MGDDASSTFPGVGAGGRQNLEEHARARTCVIVELVGVIGLACVETHAAFFDAEGDVVVVVSRRQPADEKRENNEKTTTTRTSRRIARLAMRRTMSVHAGRHGWSVSC